MAKFLLAVVLIVVGANAYLFWAATRALALSSLRHKAILAAVLLSLFLLFVLAMALSRSGDSGAVRALYAAALFLQGIFWQVVFWALILLPAVVLANHFGQTVNLRILSMVVFLAVIALSVGGALNARYGLTVRQVDLTFPDLPDSLDGKKIVHLTDLHVGLINREANVRRVAEAVRAAEPDWLFVTGDVFDASGAGVRQAIEPLREICPSGGVYAVLGNHDVYHSREDSIALMRNLGWRVLRDEAVSLGEGVTLAGLDYMERDRDWSLDRTLERLGPERFGILLRHEPIGAREAAAAGFSLMLAGHTHRGQVWPFRIFTRLAYPGRDFGLKCRSGFCLNVSSGTGTWGPYIRTSGRPEIVVITLKGI